MTVVDDGQLDAELAAATARLAAVNAEMEAATAKLAAATAKLAEHIGYPLRLLARERITRARRATGFIRCADATASVDERCVLAALEVLGWPDDRAGSAHVDEDGHEVTEAGHYWEMVVDVLDAADAAART